MSVYQLSTVRTRLGQLLDDTAFDVATANQFINDGQRDLCNSRHLVFMERESDVTTTASSNSLTGLPTDMQSPISLRIYTPIGNSTLLKYIEYDELDASIPNQTYAGNNIPAYWYTFNLIPYIYPYADNTYTLKLKYIKAPTELSADADVPEIPESFSESLVLAAYKRALLFNDEDSKAQLIQQQIDILLDRMVERYKRQSGEPRVLRSNWSRRRIKAF